MKQSITKFHKPLAALIIILSLSLVSVLGYLGGVFDFPEYKLYDARVKLFAQASRPSDDIILILLDQYSLDWAQRERGWGWPWPRKAYAEIVDYMNLGGAKSVAFDVLFSEPSVYRNARQDEIIDNAVRNLEQAQAQAAETRSPRTTAPLIRDIIGALQELGGRKDDASFAQAGKNYGRVVQTIFFSTQAGSLEAWPEGLDKPLFKLEGFDPIISRFNLPGDTGRAGAQFPVPELRDTAGILGNVTGYRDLDDEIRRVKLFTVFDGKAVPGLSAASLIVSGWGNTVTYNQKKKLIQWGDYSIPVDKNGSSLLRFRGELDRYIPYYAGEILQSAEAYAAGTEPLLPPEDFKDKYVFFGFYAPGLYDIFNTPISSVYPGMGIHVTMLDNILQQDFIRESPVWLGILIIAVSVILIVLLVLFSNRIPLTVGGTVLVFGVLIVCCTGAYQFAGTWVPLAAPLSAAALAFITATLYSYATEGSQKRFIKSAFSRYLAPSVIEQIIADPSKLNLGGEKREMTAIFTDIQRFSSISEALQHEYADEGPKVLVNLLNLYLTEMSDIVLANGGTIDKYEGDAIIAFFGAPIWTEKHASLACRSALEMKKREKELVGEIMKNDGPFSSPLSGLIEKGVIRGDRPLYTRLGINSGSMVVGNMGTPNKMDYTIMGNAVNLAARLEGVNKQYDTGGILISEYTRDKIGDEFVIRGLSRVRVVGINTPLRLYELLELREEASEETLDMVELWEKGFRAYENQEFLEAKNTFAAVLGKNGNDRVAKLYLGRCEKYLPSPPLPEKWDDGVDNLTEK
ncbi:MAG: adenylate/guanylate cyclase domain-containing protein [Treponema sp.]|jgi:adenylate cyclase|nr:adenylate/guanylate cyclase domain-containing protein [Treponema sp.]